MCTAVTYQTKDFYFGRNLDMDYRYNEEITVTPRGYSFPLRNGMLLKTKYAMIGMATVELDYPLYYEATNEKGLSLAGLNFPGNAIYLKSLEGKDNIAPFELIPWILGQCANLNQAMALLQNINIWGAPFSEKFPLSPLHWMLADKSGCAVLEPIAEGLQIHDDPVGILTNNPPFPFHIYNLTRYMQVTARQPENRFCTALDMKPYSLGMGSIGLPGDMSSPSRFVRAAFTKLNSVSGSSEADSVGQFFHILGCVCQQRGLTCTDGNRYEYTQYSSCCNCDKGIYYYTTYGNSQITAVDMYREDLDGSRILRFPVIREQQIRLQNCRCEETKD